MVKKCLPFEVRHAALSYVVERSYAETVFDTVHVRR